MDRRRWTAMVLAGFVACLAAGAAPLLAAEPDAGTESTTVEATVVALSSAACLELSATAIDFGTRAFGSAALADPPVTVTNCATVVGDILVAGSNATGSSAAWTLWPSSGLRCSTGLSPNLYRVEVVKANGSRLLLSTTGAFLDTLGASASIEVDHSIQMPCPGSGGAGEAITFGVTYTAVTE